MTFLAADLNRSEGRIVLASVGRALEGETLEGRDLMEKEDLGSSAWGSTSTGASWGLCRAE